MITKKIYSNSDKYIHYGLNINTSLLKHLMSGKNRRGIKMKRDKRTVDMIVLRGETSEISFDDAPERTPVVFLGRDRAVIKYCVYGDGDDPSATISVAVSVPREQLAQALPVLSQGNTSRLGNDLNYADMRRQGGGWYQQNYRITLVNPGFGCNIHGLDVRVPLVARMKMSLYGKNLYARRTQ